MAKKKKGEAPIQKIIVGIIVTVASSLILAWLGGAFDNSTTNPTPNSTNQIQQNSGPKSSSVKPGGFKDK
mgnify:CR=1 FL=1